MNVSLSAHAAGVTGAGTAKHGKGGDPLADFMALLGQLGITIEGDGTLTAPSVPGTEAGTQDIAAKLLAKLGKKVGEAPAKTKGDGAPTALPEDPTADAEVDSKTEDPVTTLADLLAKIDPNAAQAAEPAKIDISTLIAAVRAIATDVARPQTETAPEAKEAKVVAATPKAAPTIASLLARTGEAKQGDVTPGTVQAAFTRLEKLVTDQSADDVAAPETRTTDQAQANQRITANAKLTELLARLTASTKPGAGAAQAVPLAAAHAARPQVDPQIAAIAQTIQQPASDKPTKDSPIQPTAPQPVADASLGLISATQPAATAVPAATSADAVPVNTADALTSHHLDIARDTQWLDTLARDIARAAHSDTQLRFQLNPEHLGSLKVELLNGVNGTSVKLTADTEAARAILVDAQPRLVAEARAQGLRISEAHVDLSGQNGGGGQRQTAETPVVIRTVSSAGVAAEVQQDMPASSGERYA